LVTTPADLVFGFTAPSALPRLISGVELTFATGMLAVRSDHGVERALERRRAVPLAE
jgi:hypothetical protein